MLHFGRFVKTRETQPVDQQDGTQVPASGDAATDIQAALEALLAKRTDTIKQETFRDTQRAFDKRFSTVDQMAGQLGQLNERLSRFEQMQQAAEEQNLEPEERANRNANRQSQRLYQEKLAAENANLQNHVYGLVMAEFSDAGIKRTDPRIVMPDIQIAQDPRGWQAAMVREIWRVKGLAAEEDSAARIRQAIEEERRKVVSGRETQRVEQNNARRAEASGQIERAVPTGTVTTGMAKYYELKAQGKNKEAREFAEQLGKLAKAGQLKSLEAS